MRREHLVIVGLLSIALVSGACGKSDAQKQAEETAKAIQEATKAAAPAAEQVAKGAEAAAKGLEAFAKGMQGLGATGGDGKPVDPVSFKELQTVFPNLDGWVKGKPTGERMTMPVRFSQAEIEYRNGDSRIQMKIVDSGFNQLLLIPYSMFLTSGYEKETANGYEKSTTVAGHPGWEKWNSESKNGEVNALVAKRFVFTIEGDEIADTKLLHQVAAKSDLAHLASLAK